MIKKKETITKSFYGHLNTSLLKVKKQFMLVKHRSRFIKFNKLIKFNRLFSKTGSIFLPIVISITTLPMILFVGHYVLQYKSQQVETDNFILFKESIQSVIKYTLFGVERKWCFNDKWGYQSQCDKLTDPMSSERVLFGDIELAKLEKLRQDNPSDICTAAQKTCLKQKRSDCDKCINLPTNLNTIKLNSFYKVFSSSDLKDKTKFALSDYFQSYTSSNTMKIKMNTLKITISNEAQTYQVRGSEKYIKVKIETNFTEKSITKNYTAEWDVSLFPREMNTFSLVLARDMYFYDTTSSLPPPARQTIQPDDKCVSPPSTSTKFEKITEAQKSSYKGLTFQSPVFVNGNLHFKKYASGTTPSFTPIYFFDKLFLGKGEFLYGQNQDFTPSKAGYLMDYNHLNMGGFYKGVVLEKTDKGLEVFSGQEACESRNDTLEECLHTPEILDYSVNSSSATVTSVSGEQSHTCAIQNQKLYCWGYNGYGQIGDGTRERRTKPKLVADGTETTKAFQNQNVTKVSNGSVHTCAIQAGRLYCWGRNEYGQIGDGTYGSTNYRNKPTLVADGTTGGTNAFENQNVTKVSAGSDYTCAIQAGRLYCWGKNNYGRLGDGNTVNQHTKPKLVADGTETTNAFQNQNVTKVSTGVNNTCAIQAGRLYCWGDNTYGQLGDGTTGYTFNHRTPTLVANDTETTNAFQNQNVTSVSTGYHHTCAIQNQKLYCWGRNNYGQLGDGTTGNTNNRNKPKLVADGTETTNAFQNQNIQMDSVSTGGNHTCAIQNQKLYCWGRNNYGQLGDGTTGNTNNRNKPKLVLSVSGAFQNQNVTSVSTGYHHTCAIQNQKLYCWGRNGSGQLGDGTTDNKKKAVKVTFPSSTYVFDTGANHTCFSIAYDDDGNSVSKNICWGYNASGQLGIGNTDDVHLLNVEKNFFPEKNITQVSTGGSHTCAIQNQKLYCWGQNNHGQIGDGRLTPIPTLRPYFLRSRSSGFQNQNIKQVSTGGSHTCAIQNQKLYCWGQNNHGQIGDGTTDRRASPTLILNGTETTNPFQNQNVQSVSTGLDHTCAIQNQKLYCWGDNLYGQIGDGTYDSINNRKKPKLVSSVSGAFQNQNVTSVSTGDFHTCAIQAGKLYCWGRNNQGQIGDGTTGNTNNRKKPKLVSSVSGAFQNQNVTSVSTGRFHTCAIQAGKLYCWGHNFYGQIGDGTTTSPRKKPKLVKNGTETTNAFQNQNIKQVSTGYSHTCAIQVLPTDNKAKLYCWGQNNKGQLAKDPSDLNRSTTPLLITSEHCPTEDPENFIGSLDWFFDLSPFTRSSWDFTDRGTDKSLFILDDKNATRSGVNFRFQNKALFGHCIVKSTADFVTGFFVCDKFTIEQRTTPLRIIGTVISSQLNVHKTALQHGVTWGSIWQAQALYELRDQKILTKGDEYVVGTDTTLSKSDCNNNKNFLGNPIHPENRATSLSCNPVGLMKEADPFTWTSVDPDCAHIDENSRRVSCKFYIRKFISRPILKKGTLN